MKATGLKKEGIFDSKEDLVKALFLYSIITLKENYLHSIKSNSFLLYSFFEIKKDRWASLEGFNF
jgi:hypothetical protein